MAPPIDVCIRGAGIVGSTLALLLARDRLRVGLVGGPQPSGGHSDVRAYALNAASKDLLERLRAWPDEAHATPVAAMEVHGDEGGLVSFRAADEGVPALAWIADVPPLEAQLAQALRFQPMVERLDAPRAAPLTVVCEGRTSTTRAEFNVHFEVSAYSQQAIAARFDCELPHGQVARQWFHEGDILALLPLGGPGGNTVALVWSVQDAQAPGLLALPPEEFQSRVAAASHHALGKLKLASERRAWSLQLAHAQDWCGPGWALAGDAAHTVHPLAGQGLNLGLADAEALAKVLHEREYWRGPGDARLLRRYERSRKAAVLAMGFATDGLQQLFARPGEPWTLLRNAGMKGFEWSGPLKHWVARQAMGRL
ncbi:MAG TPA: FAD-dependent monooxygenase [Ramlibacter sp.]|uniref:FAD-dependent monooxygenase n=1 Tax=Ramlibacter sp. TaxID=1917967 RepID=UPI002C33429D|nr:FAD-dependent monooxygenase [Ramlibacter sp.]HVZ45533.1 FAD-dependent monooxygenase [Ramlibacter sp.]